MGHYLINPTFRCQLKCPYCLLDYIKIDRKVKEHSWLEWSMGMIKYAQPNSIIDVAGGDPLLFPGLAFFLRELGEAGLRWAITTNAMSKIAVNELIEVNPKGCVLVNISDHPGNEGAADNVRLLKAHFHVVFNRVDHPKAGKHFGNISSLIPYQLYKEGQEQDYRRRMCNSGKDHWVADPAGNVFQCNVAMATGREPIGNLFSGGIRQLEYPYVCDWGCSSCYLSVPNAWLENNWEIE